MIKAFDIISKNILDLSLYYTLSFNTYIYNEPTENVLLKIYIKDKLIESATFKDHIKIVLPKKNDIVYKFEFVSDMYSKIIYSVAYTMKIDVNLEENYNNSMDNELLEEIYNEIKENYNVFA